MAIFSLLINIGLVLIELLFSRSTGSLSLWADAVHSFIDIFGSSALILGLIISRRKSSAFPYGLYKVENVVAVILSLLLFGTTFEIIYQAVFAPSEIHAVSGWVLTLVAALILVPFLFGRYEVRMRNQLIQLPPALSPTEKTSPLICSHQRSSFLVSWDCFLSCLLTGSLRFLSPSSL